MDLKTQRFHYKGNEYVTENGLDRMDFNFRQYDPQTGRFFSVDPLAALSTRWSSYSYGYNNPIRFIDEDGMYVDDYDYDDDYDGVQDWFRKDGTNKMVYFPGLDEQSTPEGYTWFAKRFSGTDSEGRDVWADEYGNILYDNPHWENLPAVTVSSSYNPSNDGNENDWLQDAQTGIGAFDFAHGAKEELINYAAKSIPAINEMKYVKAVKVASKGLFGAQAVISGVQVYNAWDSNNSNKWGVTGKAGLDVTIGYFSLVGGPVGWGVGAVYFIGDAAGWWGNWGQAAPSPLDINKR